MFFEGINIYFEIVILILLLLMVVIAIWSLFLQLSIFFHYIEGNKEHVGGKTAKQIAEEMLNRLGYNDIEVCRASYLWMLFFRNWGNRYSPRRRKILLYNNILEKDTVTAIALATQKVGLVVQHKQGEKQMKFRAKWEIWTRPAPNLLLPIVTIGVIIDLIMNKGNWEANIFGIFSLIFLVIAIIYTLIAFYALYLIIPTEYRAGVIALQTIQQYELLPPEHIDRVATMYSVYVRKYISDFVLALLELTVDIIRLALMIGKEYFE